MMRLMNLGGLGIILGMAAFAGWSWLSQVCRAESGTPAPGATPQQVGPKEAAFRSQLDAWVSLLEQIQGIRVKYPNANPAEMAQLREKYEQLMREVEKQLPALIAAA